MRVSTMPRHRAQVGAVAVMLAMALVAGACGSDDDEDSTPTSAPAPADAGVTTTAAAPVETGADTTAATPADSTGGSTASSTVTTGGSDAVQAGSPKAGGTITIGIEAESATFDPFNGNIAFPGRSIISLINGSLTASDSAGNYVPYLAKSVEPDAEAKVWTIGLHEGMTFSDGTPYDAQSIKTHFDRGMNDSLQKGAWPYIVSVEAVDPLTVEITLNLSMSQFPQVLADALGNISSPAALEKYGEDYGNNPVGAGPYMVDEFVRDDHLTLVKNPTYFFAGMRGWADTLIFKPIPDDAARAAALEAGDVDVISTANPGDIENFKGNDDFTVYERANGASGLLFSVKNIPDIRIRRAVAMAVDKEAITDLVYGGSGKPVETPWPEDSFWYTDVDAPEFDPEAAAALVEEVKAEGGDTSVEILSGIDETSNNYKSIVVEQLRAIGLDVTPVNAADGNDQVNRYIEGNYEIYTAGVFAVIDPWFEYTRRYKSDSVLNGTGFKNEELDAALLEGAATTDPDARKAAYDKVQNILAENVVQIFVHENSYGIIANNHIKGFGEGVNPDGSISYMNFFISVLADEYWRDDA